jgi:drug/metabolite transporter (DMT)-like permease
VILGAVSIVLGIWFLSLEGERGTFDSQKKVLGKGLALAIATALLWSVSIAMMDLAVTETPNLADAFAINSVRVFAVAISFVVSAPIVDRGLGFLRMRKRTAGVLLVSGIVALALGWFFLTYSFIDTPQSRAVPISSATPLFSTLAAILLLHEKVSAKNAIGSIMIVAGIFIIFLV